MADNTHALVARLNTILDRAQDVYNQRQVARHAYQWQDGKTDEESVAILAQTKHELYIRPGRKYIKIDRVPKGMHEYGSGVFMVDITDGRIYGIKAYGVPHRGHSYGTVDAPDIRRLAMAAAVMERGEVAAALTREG